ncbi:2Fe-2S iron-sulfur cluster-binding protein [Paracoccus sp. CPCC 101403]|uniref:2Fe-2S iron-sulfur cluster-binding protein n=2 Tax=Paracoccus broussonetiae TaxID=3075834 RepID=A0ABU3EK13_9RHOB|nr:2Fe-2S iron-sulfur cluster-binding protein [Paracoccus sp. CPCC 101403]MDT1064117.1 2Fe-2S iron-sulfur cluster-binding protein [Paracoccus sp. CPCC 101403]
MTQITWKCASGQSITINVTAGQSLMEAARDHDVDGIFGDCGGNLACATCHVIVPPEWVELTGKPDAMEEDMLDIVETGRTPTSRLSCQIVATHEMDGMVLEVPGA